MVYIIVIPIYFKIGMNIAPAEYGYWAITSVIWPMGICMTIAVGLLIGLLKLGLTIAGYL